MSQCGRNICYVHIVKEEREQIVCGGGRHEWRGSVAILDLIRSVRRCYCLLLYFINFLLLRNPCFSLYTLPHSQHTIHNRFSLKVPSGRCTNPPTNPPTHSPTHTPTPTHKHCTNSNVHTYFHSASHLKVHIYSMCTLNCRNSGKSPYITTTNIKLCMYVHT